MSAPYTPLMPRELAAKREEGWRPFILDVRSEDEWRAEHLDFADLQVPHTEVLSVVDKLPKDRDIVVHCRLGGRSAMACLALNNAGFERLFNLEGGLVGWVNDVDEGVVRG